MNKCTLIGYIVAIGGIFAIILNAFNYLKIPYPISIMIIIFGFILGWVGNNMN